MTPEQKAMVHEHFEKLGLECIKDNMISEEDITNMRSKKVPTGEKAPCFLACIMRKTGLVCLYIVCCLNSVWSSYQEMISTAASAICYLFRRPSFSTHGRATDSSSLAPLPLFEQRRVSAQKGREQLLFPTATKSRTLPYYIWSKPLCVIVSGTTVL